MRVVVDTNVILQAIPDRGRYHAIYRAIRGQSIEFIASNEILLEYEEIILARGASGAWVNFRDVLDLLESTSGTVRFVSPSYQWSYIGTDADDNKFVDAAVHAGADWIVTEDHHYDVLLRIDACPETPIHPRRFIEAHLPA